MSHPVIDRQSRAWVASNLLEGSALRVFVLPRVSRTGGKQGACFSEKAAIRSIFQTRDFPDSRECKFCVCERRLRGIVSKCGAQCARFALLVLSFGQQPEVYRRGEGLEHLSAPDVPETAERLFGSFREWNPVRPITLSGATSAYSLDCNSLLGYS